VERRRRRKGRRRRKERRRRIGKRKHTRSGKSEKIGWFWLKAVVDV